MRVETHYAAARRAATAAAADRPGPASWTPGRRIAVRGHAPTTGPRCSAPERRVLGLPAVAQRPVRAGQPLELAVVPVPDEDVVAGLGREVEVHHQPGQRRSPGSTNAATASRSACRARSPAARPTGRASGSARTSGGRGDARAEDEQAAQQVGLLGERDLPDRGPVVLGPGHHLDVGERDGLGVELGRRGQPALQAAAVRRPGPAPYAGARSPGRRRPRPDQVGQLQVVRVRRGVAEPHVVQRGQRGRVPPAQRLQPGQLRRRGGGPLGRPGDLLPGGGELLLVPGLDQLGPGPRRSRTQATPTWPRNSSTDAATRTPSSQRPMPSAQTASPAEMAASTTFAPTAVDLSGSSQLHPCSVGSCCARLVHLAYGRSGH